MTEASKSYRYLEIVAYEGDKVARRIDVTGRSDSIIERIECGMNINLNHEDYYVREQSSETPLAAL